MGWVAGALAADEPDEKTGALIDTDRIVQTLVVDPRLPTANDRNPGTEAEPLRTIQAALNRAKAHLLQGEGVRISLAPITFRESARIRFPAEVDPDTPPLIIEAMEIGETRISGADPMEEGWDAEEGYLVRDWPFELPRMFGGDASLASRRELLLMADVRLVQVARKGAVRQGKFWLDEAEGKVWMLPPRGASAARDVIMVGQPERGQLFRAENVPSLLLQGIVFEQAPSGIGEEAAVYLRGGVNAYVNGCGFDYNNGTGLVIEGAQYATVFGSYANRNGWAAVEVQAVQAAEVGGLEANLNAWRLLESGKNFPGAVVEVSADDAQGRLTLYRSEASNNHRDAFFARAATVEGKHLTVNGNKGYGLWLEAGNATGSVTLEDAKALQNGGAGYTLRPPARLAWSLGYGNDGGQLRLLNLGAAITVENSVLISDGAGEAAITLTNATPEEMAESYTGERNLFYGGDVLASGFNVNGHPLGFDAWRALTGSDLTSRHADPHFEDMEALDFGLVSGSPLFERGQWEPQALQLTREEALKRLQPNAAE